jgi:hypothetical protein
MLCSCPLSEARRQRVDLVEAAAWQIHCHRAGSFLLFLFIRSAPEWNRQPYTAPLPISPTDDAPIQAPQKRLSQVARQSTAHCGDR